jgi:hypothetical protein
MIETRTILLFGRSSHIKEDFFRKLMVSTSTGDSDGAAESVVSEHSNGIKTGVKTFANLHKDGGSKLIFTELWDIPSR